MSSRVLNLLRYNRNLVVLRSYLKYNYSSLATVNNKVQVPITYAFPKIDKSFTHNLSTKLREKKVKSITFDEFFQNVNEYFKANGSVYPEIFAKAIDVLDTNLTVEQSLFLLESCADFMPSQKHTERIKLFHKIWDHLKSINLLEKSHYLIALKVFQANRIPLTDIQDIFIDCPFKDEPQFYEGLIRIACENGDVKQSTEILAEMREKNVPLSENIFNALILGHSRNNDLNNCQLVLDTMNAANLIPSTETISELLRANIENGKFEKAEKLLTEHGTSFNIKQIAKIVKCSADQYQINLVQKSIKLLPTELLNVREIKGIIRNICMEFIYSGNCEKAFIIVNSFPTPNFKENENIDTFGIFLINEMIRSGQHYHTIIDICKKLIETNKNTRALHIATEIILRRNPEMGGKYLKSLSEYDTLKPHYFWPLFIYYFRTSGEIGIINTLKKMSELKVECDYETLSFYCLPRLSIILQDAEKAVKILEDCGLKTSQFLTPLISNMLMQQKQFEIIKLNELYPTKLDTSQFIFPLANVAINIRSKNHYKNFAKLMQSLFEKSENPNLDLVGQVLKEILANPKLKTDIEIISKILQELNNLNIKISSNAVDVLSGHLGKFEGNESAENARNILYKMINKNLSIFSGEMSGSHIAHPRDMTFDELECHLIELESKKLNSRGVLRRLLQLSVRDNRLERAIELKKKCDELKVQISPGMMASIFEMYIKLRDLKAAKESMIKLKKMFPGFLVDEHKIIDFAALLIEKSHFQEARDLIIERAATTKIIGGDYINKNIWNLLTTCAQASASSDQIETQQNKTKEFFLLLQNKGFCKAKNVVLGPIIREYLNKNDIKLAVQEYEHITEKYKKTPLQFELMSLLVSISNGNNLERFKITEIEGKNLLQTVTTLTGQIHGPINANSSLLLAIAESGTENQLRKLLINPEFRINQEVLTKNCDHLSSSGRIQTILKLAKASRGLGHVLKEQNLYSILLDNFVKDNNYTAALELFEKLEADDDLKISQDFLKNLIDLLRINNVEIPTAVSLRAQFKN